MKIHLFYSQSVRMGCVCVCVCVCACACLCAHVCVCFPSFVKELVSEIERAGLQGDN